MADREKEILTRTLFRGPSKAIFEALAKAGVNIGMISTSEIKISVVIALDKSEQAIRAVHDAFIG